jgi:hypothetical protein
LERQVQLLTELLLLILAFLIPLVKGVGGTGANHPHV